MGAELIRRGRDSTQPECIGLRPGLASEFGIEVVLASTGLLLLCLLRETWKPGSRLAKMLRPPNLAELPPHQHCHSLFITLTNSRRKTSEVEPQQLWLRMRVCVFLQVRRWVRQVQQAAVCSSTARRPQAAGGGKKAQSSSSARRSSSSPAASLCCCVQAAHCTAHTSTSAAAAASRTHLAGGKCCKICKFLRRRNGRRAAWELNVND